MIDTQLAGLAVGAAMGVGMGWLTVRLRDRRLLAPELDARVAIGAVLSVAVYLFFTKALSLALPAGPPERLIGRLVDVRVAAGHANSLAGDVVPGFGAAA